MKRFLLLFFIILSASQSYAAKDSDQIKLDWYVRQFNNDNLSVTQRLQYSDSILTSRKDSSDWKLTHARGELFFRKGDYKMCFESFRLLERTIPSDSIDLKVYSKWMQSISAFSFSNYLESMQIAFEILRMEKPKELKKYDLHVYMLLSDFYQLIKMYSQANVYNRSALNLLESSDSIYINRGERQRLKSSFHRAFANTYLGMGNTEKALQEAQIACGIIPDGVNVLEDYIIFGDIALKENDMETSEKYYREALKIKTYNFNRNFAIIGLIKIFLNQNKIQNIPELLTLYQNDVNKIYGGPLECQFLTVMADYYEKAGLNAEAIKAMRRINVINEEMSRNIIVPVASMLARNYDEEVNSEKIDVLNKRVNLYVVILIIAAVIVAAALTAVWRHRKQIKHKQHEISGLETKINNISQTHASVEQLSKHSIESQGQQLASMTMYMGRLNEVLRNMQSVILEKDKNDKEKIDMIDKALGDLDREDNVWNMFRTYFEQVNQSFFNRLYLLCPSLTKAELRMSAFILVGLSTKEIAIMTNRSVRTVETIKHNLRKKLGINITETSDSFMRKIASVSDAEFSEMISPREMAVDA